MDEGGANKLRECRVAAGFSQKRAAERLGLTEGGVNRHERGNRKPSIEQLRQYAELYGVSVLELFIDLTEPEANRKAEREAEAERVRAEAEREAKQEAARKAREAHVAELEAEPTEWELRLRAILWHQNRPGPRGHIMKVRRNPEYGSV